jgi:hypothetical protein
MGEKMKKIWGLNVKILRLSLVAFGAQKMIVKFKLVHSFFFMTQNGPKKEDMACLKV